MLLNWLLGVVCGVKPTLFAWNINLCKHMPIQEIEQVWHTGTNSLIEHHYVLDQEINHKDLY